LDDRLLQARFPTLSPGSRLDVLFTSLALFYHDEHIATITQSMDSQAALSALRAPNAQSLSIISLTASKSSPSTLPPAALAADLTHYRDLFSKLRFSYLEQVTKERFLRALTADPPEFADAQENAELEQRLVGLKARLKEKKGEVRDMIGELEAQGRLLAGRGYTAILHGEGKC
jgi:hypothetical protein